MRACQDIDTFLNASEDRFVRCADFVAWHRAPDLLGIDVWGDGSRANIERRRHLLDSWVAEGRGRQRVLFDSSTSCDVSPMMYKAAFEFWSSRRDRHAAMIEKLAVVISNGYVGALVTGLTALLDLGYSVRTFMQLEAALTWLGESDASHLAVELRGLRPSDTADAAVLGRLQELLRDEDLSLEVTEAASRLGMSSRTLQRRLTSACTTFQAEQLRAKLARATTLMLTGKYSMTAIAFDLGFASPQHFSSRFSAVYGQPPSVWLRKFHAAEGGG